jgi:lipopolysaccharide/colanic/teichoic acid biosynthesis glycosyltransferase
MSIRDLAEAGASPMAHARLPAIRVAHPAGPPRWKRVLDVSLGLVALAVLSPVMVAAALLVRLTSRGPVLFRQERVGLNERPFMLVKFRTMRDGALVGTDQRAAIARELSNAERPESGTGLFRPVDDERVTAVGAVLRRLSVDELPQLFNVLRGEMSLVGPRPALPWEVELFTAEQRQRHACLPGMTGLWQVSGRNALNSREMLALDLLYARQCSPYLDLKILLRTPAAVLFHMQTR